MSSKVCFKCGVEKPLTEFYVHPQMGDGRLNKCKACTRKDVHENYARNIDKYRAYDRRRGFRPGDPHKVAARRAVNHAKQKGELEAKGCAVGVDCKGRIEAHHEDYSKPLDVTWLCKKHHAERHTRDEEAA